MHWKNDVGINPIILFLMYFFQLEEVMETETYKNAKMILERFDPDSKRKIVSYCFVPTVIKIALSVSFPYLTICTPLFFV